jgi:putative drug exporter of the RND superfamily
MFGALAGFMYRRRWAVVGGWVAILLIAGVFAAQASKLLGAPDYTYPSSESSRAASVLEKTFHQNGLKTTEVILTSASGPVTDPAVKRAVSELITRLRSDRRLSVDTVENPLVTHNARLISSDRRSLVVVFSTTLSENDMEQQVPHLRDVTRVPGLTTRLTGFSVLSAESNVVATKDLSRAESITIPIMLLVLLVVFGTLAAAGMPFLIAIVAIVLTVAWIWVAAHFMHISIYVMDIITFIGLGIAIDYSLFIVSRFREELRVSDNDVEASVVRTMETTGRAIFFSGLAVAVGLSALVLTGLPFMQAMGLGGMLIPLSTLVVTLTLLPALLGILGPRVNRWRIIPQRWTGSAQSTAWRSVALMIMKRPLVAGGAVLVALLLLSVPVARITLAQGTLKQSQGSTAGVLALDYLRAHFQTAPDPYVIVLQSPTSLVNERDLAAMRTLEGVAKRDPEAAQVFGPADVITSLPPSPAQTRAAGPSLSSDGRTALITVIPKHDSTTSANMDGLRRIRDLARQAQSTYLRGATLLVGGSSANEVDFDSAILGKLPLIVIVVLGMTYAFLFFAFRTLFLPLKAVILNVLSVGAAFGILQLVFQEGFGVQILGAAKVDGIPTWVLLFLFAFLFGLSMDYEVLLLSRIREAWLRTGDNAESIAGGLGTTGRLISSAAVIMAIAFSGFMLGTAVWMKEMGLGLTLSILLDATLIRIVLVPSIMTLVGRWNWWVPASLRAWSHRGGIERESLDEPEIEREPVLA